MDIVGLGGFLFFRLSSFFDASSPDTVSPLSYIEMSGPQEASDSIQTRLIVSWLH